MRFTSTLTAAAAAVLFSFTPVKAAEKRTVPANKTSAVSFIYFYSGREYDCHTPGKGSYTVADEPEHGRVHLEWRKLKGDFKGGCTNRTMGGLAVWYTPNKGYRGPDDFKIRWRAAGPGPTYSPSGNWRFKITVE